MAMPDEIIDGFNVFFRLDVVTNREVDKIWNIMETVTAGGITASAGDSWQVKNSQWNTLGTNVVVEGSWNPDKTIADAIDVIINKNGLAGQIEVFKHGNNTKKWIMFVSQGGTDRTDDYYNADWLNFASSTDVEIIFHRRNSDPDWVNTNEETHTNRVANLINDGDGFASFCEGDTYLKYEAGQELKITIDGGQNFYSIRNGTVADQTALKAILEAIYPDSDYDYAVNVTTGEVCAIFKGVNEGGGTFNYSVSLEDEITISDSLSAIVNTNNKRELKPYWIVRP